MITKNKQMDFFTSGPIDQNYVFNKLPLSQQQKENLYNHLLAEHAKGNPGLLLDPKNVQAQIDGDLQPHMFIFSDEHSSQQEEIQQHRETANLCTNSENPAVPKKHRSEP